jgi:RNA polymerase sigma-70 factor, ECF subfamily
MLRIEGGELKRGRPASSVRERQLLLMRAQAGDAEALDVLFESCRRSLYRMALRILTRPQDAEDAVQEAMLAAFKNLHRFEGRADFLTWASQIVINAALLHIRRSRKKPVVSWDQVDHEFEGTPFSERLRDPRPTPEEQLQRREHRELLEHALGKLPVKNRRPIQLCKLADYSLKEAASTLGLPVTTLKVRLHRGKRALIVGFMRETQVRRKNASNRHSLQLHSPSGEGVCAAWTA